MTASAQQEIEEVVVTAQMREQSVQDVPLSLEVVSGEEIAQQGFRDLGQLANFVPSLNIEPTVQNQVIMIRGVGTQGSNFGFEQAVPTFIDGIHFGRGSQVLNAFLDVERIEVLRGPQPVYFGQNATAGAISIVTRKPGPEWEGDVLAEFGNNARQTLQFGVGGPVTDTLGIRVAGKYDATDGYMTDVVTGDKYPYKDAKVGRVTLQWMPTDRLDVSTKVAFSDINTGGAAVQDVSVVPRADTGAGVLLAGFDTSGFAIPFETELDDRGVREGPFFFQLPLSVTRPRGTTNVVDLTPLSGQLPFAGQENSDQRNAYVELNYRLANDIVLTSRTGYIDYYRDYVRHFGTGGPFVTAPLRREEDLSQWSQELRAASSTGRSIEWIAGVYYQSNDLATKADFYVAGERFEYTATRSTDDAEWLSAFATMTFNFLDDKMSVDVGGRYTDIRKAGTLLGLRADWIVEGGGLFDTHGQVAIGYTPLAPTGQSVSGVLNESDFNPQVVLRWRPSQDISLYTKWAEAFKAGGFDTAVVSVQAADEFSFGPEVAETWEIGAKGSFWDGRATANMTLFWSEFDGLQVSSTTRGATDEATLVNKTQNVGLQRVQGAEFSGSLFVTERWSVNVSGALLDGEIVEFPGATCNDNERIQGLCTGLGGTIDRSGQDAIRTPDWQAVLGIDYWIPVASRFEITFDARFLASDGYLIDDNFDKSIQMANYTDLNLNLGFGPQDGTWRVAAWGRNLTEPLPTYYPEFDFNNEGLTTVLGSSRFRTYGVQFAYNFN